MRGFLNSGAGFDPSAPVVIREEREISASPSWIWELLVQVQRWPRWFPSVRFASLRGALTPGTALHWQVDGLRISSLLLEVEQERTLGWTLRMMGGRGFLRWSLEPLPGGGTRVRLEESWGGAMVWLLRGTLRRTLEVSRRKWLEALEAALREESA